MNEELQSVVEFDTDIATAEQPKPLPAGIYNAVITGTTIKTSKSGNRYASVMMKIGADEYPADYVDGNKEGTTLSYNRLVLENTAQAKWQLRQFCQKIGASMSNRIDVSEWLGLTAKVEVTNDMYEGVVRASIARLVD